MRVRRLAALTALPVVLAVGLTACGGGDGDGGGSGGNSNAVISIGIGEPKHLVPSNVGESEGAQVLAALFAPLVDFDKNAKPFNVVADKIETTDSKVWTIKLKDGYTWQNGEPLVAQNYIDSWNYGAYGPNGQDLNYYYEKIEGYKDLNPEDTKATPATKTMSGLKAVDDHTIQITLSQPFAEFNAVLGYTSFLPLPKAAFGPDGQVTKEYEDAPIGNGPFKIKGKWNHDQNIEVERWDGWKGTKPKIGGVNYKIYQSQTTQYSDALANNLDVVPTVPTESLATADKDFPGRYQHSPASSFQFLAFPTYDSNYSKVEVRKAISMAIDRDEIIKTIFANSQKPARSFVSPVVPGYRDNTCGDSCKYDPAKAKEMYTAAGGPQTIQITYNADGGHKEWVEATCNQLQTNLGIKCEAKPEAKFADLLNKVKAKTPGVGMFRLGWIFDYPSMEDYLGPLYATGGSSNYYGYSNPEFDKLVADGASSKTQDEAIKKYQQAEDILVKDMPVIPMRFGQNNFVFSTKVKNVELDLFQKVDLMKIEATG